MNLLLIPGLLCDPDLWSHQTSCLAEIADVSVADITGGETIEMLAQQVLSSAPERFALAGLSMGGYVAQEIMRHSDIRLTMATYKDAKLLNVSVALDSLPKLTPDRATDGRREAMRAKGTNGKPIPGLPLKLAGGCILCHQLTF